MSVATVEQSPEVLARKHGTCSSCSEPIVRDEDYITKVDGQGWMHAGCADIIRRLQEVRKELDRG
jgi:hypothetical protein